MTKTDKIIFKRFESIESLNQYAANKLIETIKINLKAKIILSGGNTPGPIYKKFNDNEVQSEDCSFVLSDERRVCLSDKLSNEGMVRKYFKKYSDSQILSLHDPKIQNYLRETPSYDLALLGLGLDGHFASIFPKMSNLNEALFSKDPLCFVSTGYPDIPRITMSLQEILKTKIIILLAANQEKLTLIESALSSPNQMPISKLLESAKNLLVLTIK